MITKITCAVSHQLHAQLYFNCSLKEPLNSIEWKYHRKIAQYYYKRARQLMGIE